MRYLWLQLFVITGIFCLGVYSFLSHGDLPSRSISIGLCLPIYTLLWGIGIFVSVFFRRNKRWVHTILLTACYLLLAYIIFMTLGITMAGCLGPPMR